MSIRPSPLAALCGTFRDFHYERREIIERAIARGELSSEVDVELALDLLAAALRACR